MDVSYYLRGLRHQEGVKPDDIVLYANALFPSIPGRYRLPWKSGTLYVKNRYAETGAESPTQYFINSVKEFFGSRRLDPRPQRIQQVMTGAGKVYEHENTYVDNEPISRLTTGFFSYEYGRCFARDFVVKRKMSVGLHDQRYPNVQDEMFQNYRSKLANGTNPMQILASTIEHKPIHVSMTKFVQ